MVSDRGEIGGAERAQARGRADRFGFADDAEHVLEASFKEILRVERGAAGEELIEEYAKAVDIRARIDVEAGQFGLLRTHVGGCSEKLIEAGEERFVRAAVRWL